MARSGWTIVIKYSPSQGGVDNQGIGWTQFGERYLLKTRRDICVAEYVGAILCMACGIPVADFVFKNGVYRVTQTLDYRVSESAAHQKVAEACIKVMAAREAAKAWGSETKKFALVCVPGDVAGIADSHMDLLLANGFEIYHYDNAADLARYHSAALSH